MLTITVSDPQAVRDPFNEALVIEVHQGGSVLRTRAVVVPRAMSAGARAFRVGMTTAEVLQELAAEGLKL